MEIVKFRREHLDGLELQEAQKELHSQFSDPGYGATLEASKYSFTALHDGKVIGCAGVHEIWEGRAIAWALLSQDSGKHFRAIHRAAAGFLAQTTWRRIEAVVESDFDAGHRWARLLGMEQEGIMRSYSPAGKDFYLYSRVKQNG